MTDKSLEEKFKASLMAQGIPVIENIADGYIVDYAELVKIAHSHYQKEEKMTEGWCEHIEWNGECWIMKSDAFVWLDVNKFGFCCRCGTPRPTHKKSLAEELADAFYRRGEHSFSTNGDWNLVADKARSVLLDGKEEELAQFLIQSANRFHDNNILRYEYIAKACLDYLKKESHEAD